MAQCSVFMSASRRKAFSKAFLVLAFMPKPQTTMYRTPFSGVWFVSDDTGSQGEIRASKAAHFLKGNMDTQINSLL